MCSRGPDLWGLPVGFWDTVLLLRREKHSRHTRAPLHPRPSLPTERGPVSSRTLGESHANSYRLLRMSAFLIRAPEQRSRRQRWQSPTSGPNLHEGSRYGLLEVHVGANSLHMGRALPFPKIPPIPPPPPPPLIPAPRGNPASWPKIKIRSVLMTV